MNRTEYVEQCTEQAQKYLKENQMFVSYIRKKLARSEYVDKKTRKEMMELLSLYPKMTESTYLRLQKKNFLTKNSNCPELDAFRIVKSQMRSLASPLVGVVVAFRENEQIMIGWSLCNQSKKLQDDGETVEIEIGHKKLTGRINFVNPPDKLPKKDEFEKHIGIWQAIKRSESFNEVKSKINNQRSGNSGVFNPYPHSVVSSLVQVIGRVERQWLSERSK